MNSLAKIEILSDTASYKYSAIYIIISRRTLLSLKDFIEHPLEQKVCESTACSTRQLPKTTHIYTHILFQSQCGPNCSCPVPAWSQASLGEGRGSLSH